ncbi:hypothetical protein SAMN03097699_0621 [Flavobacteriaceae bacterium MAR_2010_188]|nr:hypothetical protein SAMN03097699_0621 [Flavobacteriaceae bacterium MAR_2010_188]
MENKKKDKQEQDSTRRQPEGTFTRDSKERNQDFSNEQNPEAEDLSENKNHSDKSSGNLSDQYHPATETGEIQKKNNKANTKAAQQGEDYYDQGAHQPSLADEGDEDEDKDRKRKK